MSIIDAMLRTSSAN